MQLYARDLMTRNFDTIHKDALVAEAIKKILNAKVRPTGHKTVSLMVVDDDHALVGTISMHYILYHLRPFSLLFTMEDTDLSWSGELDGFVQAVKARQVHQIMNPDVLSIPPDEPLMTIVDRMMRNRVRRLSVVEHGKLIGVVYMSDIFYHLFSE